MLCAGRIRHVSGCRSQKFLIKVISLDATESEKYLELLRPQKVSSNSSEKSIPLKLKKKTLYAGGAQKVSMLTGIVQKNSTAFVSADNMP